MKYYVVRKGRNPGIYLTWEECQKQVDGYSCAEYQSFHDKESAEQYLNFQDDSYKHFGRDSINTESPRTKNYAYIDGSFNSVTGVYGYGGFIVYEKGGKRHVKIVKGSNYDPAKVAMRNVAGELDGAMAVMKEAMDLGLDEITIYYDYTGIQAWVTGEWRCNKQSTKQYSAVMNKYAEKININFIKVAGHAGVIGNEIVDIIAKEQTGILDEKNTSAYWCEVVEAKFNINR